jgi:hypothetical protein
VQVNRSGDRSIQISMSIVLGRAYIQWQKLDSLGVRVSQFLTTYGIWNADSRKWDLVAARQVIGL